MWRSCRCRSWRCSRTSWTRRWNSCRPPSLSSRWCRPNTWKPRTASTCSTKAMKMYVPGKLSDVERVLIDVGTGYYVEKTADDAREFFKRKIDFLTKQMEKIQPALQEKHAMKQAVVEMMSQKIQQLTALGAAQGATTKA
uniref:Prefoldin subunit 5 n=1 Tax=Gallus gallus TaxID=9031 RepID=A0A8V0ZT42_CHICK